MSSPVAEGDTFGPVDVTPDLGRVIRFCGLTWAFPTFFYDLESAKSYGMESTLVPGPFKLGLLAGAVETWLDGRGFVRKVRAAHRRPDFTGNPVALVGTVSRVYDEDGATRADLELAVLNQNEEPSVRGFATVEFD
jgi:hypothetical protein